MSAAWRAPSLQVPYPGPRARDVIDRLRAVEAAGTRTSAGDEPLVVERAYGSTLVDPDGNLFVDLYASFAVATIGHAHPEVTAAIRHQADALTHASSAFATELRVEVEESLRDLAPKGLDRVLPTITGADANEAALRLARTATGRREVIAFGGGYFGRAAGVIGLNGKAAVRSRFGIGPEAHFFPYPDRYRWRLGAPERAGEQILALLDDALGSPASGIGPVAAFFVEPVQGNGGVLIPPDGFLAGLRSLCDAHGIVLVFDEVQCGFGRTGRLWAAEHWSVVPDLMTVGKGIGGGLAMAAVIGRPELMTQWAPGTHTSTFLTNALNLAAAKAALEVMRRDRLWERSAVLGDRVLARLRRDLDEVEAVGDVRGLGLFLGIEVVRDRIGNEPDAARAAAMRRAALQAGVVLGSGGHHENVIRISPPLTIDEDELERALDVAVAAIRAAT
jgi:4-aminobutyrate aminotransferase-like enzyme